MAWWRANPAARHFAGLKISQDRALQALGWGVRFVDLDPAAPGLVIGAPDALGWGGNGGFHAINLAVNLGARTILLAGYDMRADLGIHWHGAHPAPLNNPTDRLLATWAAKIDAIAPQLAGLGCHVINCSVVSALAAYPKMSLAEALQ